MRIQTDHPERLLARGSLEDRLDDMQASLAIIAALLSRIAAGRGNRELAHRILGEVLEEVDPKDDE
jgi:hypothetical protein